jgi:hypothetical protein
MIHSTALITTIPIKPITLMRYMGDAISKTMHGIQQGFIL